MQGVLVVTDQVRAPAQLQAPTTVARYVPDGAVVRLLLGEDELHGTTIVAIGESTASDGPLVKPMPAVTRTSRTKRKRLERT